MRVTTLTFMNPSNQNHSGVRTELIRVLDLLRVQLARQRNRGRTPAVDIVQGSVIEEGEAEGIVVELRHDLELNTSPLESTASESTIPSSRDPVSGEKWPPFERAIEAFELNQAEYNSLILALAVELDSRFGRLVAFLNDHVGRTRPTLGMVALLSGELSHLATVFPGHWLEAIAIRDGLMELEGEGPVPGLGLRVARDMLARLTSTSAPESPIPHVRYFEKGAGLKQLVLPETLGAYVGHWADRLRTTEFDSPLIVTGASGSGRQTLAQAIATDAGWSTTVVEFEGEQLAEWLRLARREARWHGSALVLKLRNEVPHTAIDWKLLWTETHQIRRPLFVVLPKAALNSAASSALSEPAVLSLSEPDLSQRVRLWQALLPVENTVSQNACDMLAARFRFGPGLISRVVRRAESQTALLPTNQGRLTESDLEQACRELGSAAMGALAQKIPLTYERADLVIPAHLEAEFDLALAWLRRQRQVLDEWGFARRVTYGRGLTALFAGPPGTGKTMAAQVLARELGIDLYRVDFSRLMSKWIGETEKNLSQLFDEAHASGVALLFDEGDAVAGKRSEVKDAHDRYANLEISYLLQRMEEHEGVTIFATNRQGDLDEAFTRRFHFMLDFPKPNAEQRLRIWRGMFPSEARCDSSLDLARCAKDFELSGGEIKNIVLAAAFLAAQAGTPIGMNQIHSAVQRELLKSGRLADMS